jgi:hypothetical protein
LFCIFHVLTVTCFGECFFLLIPICCLKDFQCMHPFLSQDWEVFCYHVTDWIIYAYSLYLLFNTCLSMVSWRAYMFHLCFLSNFWFFQIWFLNFSFKFSYSVFSSCSTVLVKLYIEVFSLHSHLIIDYSCLFKFMAWDLILFTVTKDLYCAILGFWRRHIGFHGNFSSEDKYLVSICVHLVNDFSYIIKGSLVAKSWCIFLSLDLGW